MTVAKSEVYTPVATTEAVQPSEGTGYGQYVSMWTSAIRQGVSQWWADAQPELKSLALAAWQRALGTKPQTLLICAATAFLAGFGVMFVVMFAAILMALLKALALAFVGLAGYIWLSGIVATGKAALMPAKASKVTTKAAKK